MPTQSTNFSGANTVVYTAPNQTWIVEAGVTGQAIDDGNLVITNQPGSRLENRGTLLANQATILFLEFNGKAPDGHSLLNAVGASIVGGTAYACIGCDGAVVDNRGSISGTKFNGLGFSQSTNVTLVNSGFISGKQAGVKLTSTDGVDITNSGSITSQQYGLWVTDGVGFRPEVTNSGTLGGTLASVLVENGDSILLTNSGTLSGDVLCKSIGQNDTIVNSGKISGDVNLGSGNDVYDGQGGEVDAVLGGDGKDRITGGPTSEIFTGDAGKDRFIFSAPLNPVANVDTITDLSKNEIIELDNAIFAKLKKNGVLKDKFFDIGKKADDKKDFILYDKKTGFLAYDSDGSKKGAEAIVFAKLEDHLKLKADDLLVI